MKKYSSQHGMTLMETIIAIAIMAMLVLAAASLISTFMKSERRNRAISETEWQATSLIEQIEQSARNATSITTPATAGSSGSTLTLALTGVTAENPTTYSLSSGALFVIKGLEPSTQISSSLVTVTSFTVTNLTATGTNGTVRIALTLSYKNPSNQPELAYTTTRYTTVTIR